MRTLFIGCLGLIIGMILGAGLVIFMSSTASKPATTIVPTAATAHPDVSISVSAAFASSQIQQVLRQSGTAKNSTVTFAAPNLIRVATSIDVNALGLSLTVDTNVAMRVAVQNRRIVLITDGVDVGGLTLSPSIINSTIEPLRTQAEGEINRVVQNALLGTNLRVSNIDITTDSITIELTGQ